MLETNGRLYVGTQCNDNHAGAQYWKSWSFFVRPAVACVVWKDKKPTASAKWTLYRVEPEVGVPDVVIASGTLPSSSLGSDSTRWDLPIENLIPKRNRKKNDVVYAIGVESKLNASDTKPTPVFRATLVQRPRSQEPRDEVVDPYACQGSTSGLGRRVKVEIPAMTVHAITSNDSSATMDRDEMFILVNRVGPESEPRRTRLPGSDDYYGAKVGTVTEGRWTNKDGDDPEDPDHRVAHPVVFDKVLQHGDVADVAISIQEQDNAELADLRNALVQAFVHLLEAVSKAEPAFGGLFTALASVIDVEELVQSTSGQDLIGLNRLRLENRCGYIKTTWYSYKTLATSVGTLSNAFEDMPGNKPFASRMRVLKSQSQASFPANGTTVDFGGWVLAGHRDSFWWKAKGTHGSSYKYRVIQTVSSP